MKLAGFVSHSVMKEVIQEAANKSDDIMKTLNNINKL